MAGPQTIQRLPRGLLDALKMKGTGQTPTELAAELRATFDTFDLYMLDALTIYSPAGSKSFAAGAWFSISNDVPSGELWIVIEASMLVSCAAATTITAAQLGYLRKGASTVASSVTPFHNVAGATLAASQQTSWGGPLAKPVILQPGDVIAIGNAAMTAAPVAYINLGYYRVLI